MPVETESETRNSAVKFRHSFLGIKVRVTVWGKVETEIISNKNVSITGIEFTILGAAV